jgi:phosphoserine phosphatase
MLRERYGFAAVSGTEMEAIDGVLSGTVARYFDEHDKVRFVEDWCAQNGFSMSQVAAVGDSRSDVPLFRRAGTSIALNHGDCPHLLRVQTHLDLAATGSRSGRPNVTFAMRRG